MLNLIERYMAIKKNFEDKIRQSGGKVMLDNVGKTIAHQSRASMFESHTTPYGETVCVRKGSLSPR